MRNILFLFLVLISGVAFASPSTTLVNDAGSAIGTATNPVIVSWGAGADEAIYGGTYGRNGNYIKFNASPLYTTSNAISVDTSIYMPSVATAYALCIVVATKQIGHCTAGTYPACTTCVYP